MCGIVGIINTGNKKDINADDWFGYAMALNSLRGTDGSGIIVSKEEKTEWMNSIETGAGIIRDLSTSDKTSIRNASTVIGHCRAATAGTVTEENTHPFSIGNIVGVQNGTLEAGYEQADDYGEEDFNVDTEHLFYLIDKYGLDAAVQKVRGSMSLVWIDTEENTLNFYRNGQRPMVWGTTLNGNIFFASDEKHLKGAAVAGNVLIMNTMNTPIEKHITIPLDTMEVVIGEKTIKSPAYNYNRGYSKSYNNFARRNNTPAKKPSGGDGDRANKLLEEAGISKRVGDRVVMMPTEKSRFLSTTSKAGCIVGRHAFEYENDSSDDTEYKMIIFQVVRGVAEHINKNGYAIYGEIEGVTNTGKVKLKKSNLMIFDPTGNKTNDEVYNELMKVSPDNFWRNVIPMESTKPVTIDAMFEEIDDDLDVPKSVTCSCCGSKIDYGWEAVVTGPTGELVTYSACASQNDICRLDVEAFSQSTGTTMDENDWEKFGNWEKIPW